jgi:hypothetical protein
MRSVIGAWYPLLPFRVVLVLFEVREGNKR